MIVALLNQEGSVGNMRIALRLAGEWALRGRCAMVTDAYPERSALDGAEQRIPACGLGLFGVAGLARDALHGEAPELARVIDDIIADDQPHIDGPMRSALLAADIVLIPVRPLPFNVGASPEIFGSLCETGLCCSRLAATFELTRCGTRTDNVRETTGALADHAPPMRAGTIGQHVVFADDERSDRLAFDVIARSTAARGIAAFAAGVVRIAV